MSTLPANADEEPVEMEPRSPVGSPPVFVRVLLASTVFLGAFLLFLMEPLFAKMILPWFGGTAAVWATCLVFFQTALLAGYWYADVAARRMKPKPASVLHVSLLVVSLAFLPIAPQAFWRGHATVDPAWRILGLLAFSIGLPFVLLSATSPLVQAWYARGGSQRSPYHLYSLSNLASLLALLSFPLLIEPRLSSHRQSVVWSMFYGVFVVLCSVAAWMNRHGNERARVGEGERAEAHPYKKSSDGERVNAEKAPPSRASRMLWLALAACGSMMLVAVTNHLADNVAPIPLLWVIPLALYLLSFAMVFAKRRLYSRWLMARLLAVMLGAAGYAIYDTTLTQAIQVSVPVFCAALFMVCVFCHGELADRRPAAEHLTTFYLIVALGGALGSVAVAVVAPHLLSGVYELPIVLVLAAAAAAGSLWQEGWGARIFWWGMTGAMCAVLAWNVRTTREDNVAMSRDFYGALRVQEFTVGRKLPYRLLVHGGIQHGAQFLTWPENRNPTLYYGRKSGVGLALRFCCDGSKRVGVIGLGAGTLASYGKAGDYFRFYDIDPQVVKIANTWFTFLRQSPAKPEITLGDARLSLESEAPQQFDVLAVDAFSGDAIPVHLLTREAFAVYFRHLRPEGILAVHVSNTYLDLAPVVKLLAEDADYATRLIAGEEDDAALISASDWVLVTRNQTFLNVPETFVGSRNIEMPGNLRIWTDDYNNLFEILRTVRYVSETHGGD